MRAGLLAGMSKQGGADWSGWWAGVEQVLREAVDAGASVGIIAATSSSAEEGIVQGALKAIDDDLAGCLHVFTHSAEPGGAREDSGGDTPPSAGSFEQSIAAAQAKVRMQLPLSLLYLLSMNGKAGAPVIFLEPA